MLISQSVKNLISGVSQQPPILRFPEQLEEQINGFSTEAAGLQKRPPTLHKSFLPIPLEEGVAPLIHFVNRDERERYLFTFTGKSLHAFDLSGHEHTITIASDADYLKTDNPRRDIRIITIADHTFIINRTVKVKMRDTKSPDAFRTQGALIHVRQGQYGRTYAIWVNGSLAVSYTTPDGSSSSHTHTIDTSEIAKSLSTQLRAKGYQTDVGNCWVRIRGEKLKIATSDGFNNQAMIGITTTVQKFSTLPASAPNGYLVKVTGDPNNGSGCYYVEYNEEDQVWEECCRPGIETQLDPATMPHILVREADGTFTFQSVEWGERAVGDDDSNPLPSFVGETLNDIFFYRNRLGLLAGENVILSESAEYYNFWMTTAGDVLDTDTIDVSTTTDRVNILNYAVPFNGELYCFSESTQFILRADTVLSPKNVALVNVTGFNSAPVCRPIVCGKNLYFPSERAEYTSIKEYYYVPSATEIQNAHDITSHVASYLPNHVHQIIPAGNENLLLCLTDGDPKALYLYKYLFQNETRVQSAWSKWDMGDTLLSAFFIENVLYLVKKKKSGQCVLENMHFTYDTKDLKEEPYRVYLDGKMVIRSATYDAYADLTTLLLTPYLSLLEEEGTVTGFLLPDGTYHTFTAEEIKQKGTVILRGKHDTEPIIMGRPYTFKITLSPLYIRKQDTDGRFVAKTNGRLQIRTLHLEYANTGGFLVTVKSRGNTYQYRMTGRPIGSTKLDTLQLVTGTFRVPIQAENTAYEASIVSDMPLPLSLIGFRFDANFHETSKGV